MARLLRFTFVKRQRRPGKDPGVTPYTPWCDMQLSRVKLLTNKVSNIAVFQPF